MNEKEFFSFLHLALSNFITIKGFHCICTHVYGKLHPLPVINVTHFPRNLSSPPHLNKDIFGEHFIASCPLVSYEMYVDFNKKTKMTSIFCVFCSSLN